MIQFAEKFMPNSSRTRKSDALAAQIRQAKVVLRQLQETLEDLEDRIALIKAKKKNAGKPAQPWSEVAKELGIDCPHKR
jgi:hypothetical protein